MRKIIIGACLLATHISYAGECAQQCAILKVLPDGTKTHIAGAYEANQFRGINGAAGVETMCIINFKDEGTDIRARFEKTGYNGPALSLTVNNVGAYSESPSSSGTYRLRVQNHELECDKK